MSTRAKKLIARRPSPALVVSSIALIVALSGTAIGLPGKNRVDSGDIKNNAVRGKDVREGTLGAVPNANRLGGAGPATYLKDSDLDSLATDSSILSLAGAMDTGDPPLVLDTFGPFTFTATCTDEGLGVTHAHVDIATSADNAYLFNVFEVTDEDFDIADSPLVFMDFQSDVADAIEGHEPHLWDAESELGFFDEDGEHFAVAVNTAGADCLFAGYAFAPSG